jgi:uncharacterized protein (TIGR03083 family)
MSDDLPGVPATPDDVAAYALDALEAEDHAAVTAHLRATPDAARRERALRSAAGEFAGAVVEDVPPPADLRSRVLTEARRRRVPAVAVAGASPIEVHRVEVSRAILLLRDLTEEDWARPVDEPVLAGWTVHDVAAHLVANESLLAHHLGVPVPGVRETATDNEGRTGQARARHAGRSPAAAVAELERAAEATTTAVAARGEARLDEPVDWWGGQSTIRRVLLLRAFESWTHADDIRRPIGADPVAPPPASLLTMAHAGCGLVPSMLTVRGVHHPGRLVRFRFVDLGEAWDVDLGVAGEARPAGGGPVDAEIVTDAVGFCRAIIARVPPDELRCTVGGDVRLAGDVLAALPALSVL